MLTPFRSPSFSRLARLIALVAVVGSPGTAGAAETYTLEEPAAAAAQRAYRVSARLTAGGKVHTPLVGGKAAEHEFRVVALHVYRERRLPPAGRDAAALRSLRDYEQANSKASIGDHTTYSRLPSARSLIVAQGDRAGAAFYSPDGPLTRGELDLLHMSGDSLPLLGLLPATAVEVGETWTPESWVAQMLTNTEAAVSSRLTCKLESVDDGKARVTFEGKVDGATRGASAELSLSGHFVYDLDRRHIASWELRQGEKRSVGAVSPGMDVEAVVTGTRAPAADAGPLTDAALAAVPLEPTDEPLRLRLDLPWGAQIVHDRRWHVFQQTEQVVLLRLMDRGSLLGQCNITRLPSAAAGKHLSVERFHDDVRAALGERLRSIEAEDELPAPTGHFRYVIQAAGEVKDRPYEWTYYLCASPEGRQVAFVFTIEPELRERFGRRDRDMVDSLRFLTSDLTPAERK